MICIGLWKYLNVSKGLNHMCFRNGSFWVCVINRHLSPFYCCSWTHWQEGKESSGKFNDLYCIEGKRLPLLTKWELLSAALSGQIKAVLFNFMFCFWLMYHLYCFRLGRCFQHFCVFFFTSAGQFFIKAKLKTDSYLITATVYKVQCFGAVLGY